MKIATLLFLSVLLPLTELVHAQDDRQLTKQFQREFSSSPRRPRTPEERQRALALLAEVDSAEVAKVLVEAAGGVGEEIAAVEARRAGIQAEIAELIEGQESAKRRVLPAPKLERYNELRALDDQSRNELDGLRELLGAVRDRIATLRSPGALAWLVDDALADRRLDLSVKLAIARAAGTAEGLDLADVIAGLPRARDPGQVLALIDAVALRGPAAREAVPQLVARLKDADGRIRERAAQALAKLAAPEGIAPMIDLLERERGTAQKRIAAALEILTGQQFGTQVGSWRAWFAAEGAAVLAGDRPLGQGRPSQRSDTERGYYFDIPQDGKSMVYIIDASGSMAKEIEMQVPGTSTGIRLTTRLAACKEELIRALGTLPRDTYFNVIWYSDLPYIYDARMQRADEKTIAAAQEWVRKLSPAGSTNIHDALQMAFTLTGQGAKDKNYELAVDMIFLLTDGSPTKPDGSLDSTDKILVAVREWNPLKRVTIHTIGIGGELNAPFLEQLARENGGEFRQK
ncbi:MAG: VWA domain-containing protein [Planctomycetes bacterium]|nr:VWA domain-containing protein [Planctomycetota bacterium]